MKKTEKHVGEKIEDLRNELGLTMYDMAARLNINQYMFVYWRKGTKTPSLQTVIKIKKLAKEMGIDWNPL